MAYATFSDVELRLGTTFDESKQALCTALLDDAAVIIDSFNAEADAESKKIVSCRMVMRTIGNSNAYVPMGATQGSMSALGYSQSWTMGGGGSTGELYLTKTDKKLLGVGSKLGAHSPLEDM